MEPPQAKPYEHCDIEEFSAPVGAPPAPTARTPSDCAEGGQIEAACPYCKRTYRATQDRVGWSAQCAACGARIHVGFSRLPGPGAAIPIPQSRLPAQSPQAQTLHAPSATRPGTFFYRSEENLQVLRSLLARREEDGAFLGGLKEYMSFSGIAGGLAHGFLGRIIYRLAGSLVYLSTCPVHIIRYRRATARLAERAERIRRTLTNTSVTPPLGENRKPLSWLTYTGPWFFLFARARMKRIRKEIERHTGRRVGGWWMPSGGLGQAAKALRAHFEQESGTLVADPDRPICQLATEITDRMPLDTTPHGDAHVRERILVQYKEELVERRDCTWRRWTSQRKKVNLLQDALNRHWEFHQRTAGPGSSAEQAAVEGRARKPNQASPADRGDSGRNAPLRARASRKHPFRAEPRTSEVGGGEKR